eukprot:TRINITY_DN11946_c0_g1_i1.p1 TRINITY_DN11946_c0_g1~~TRINITY_DN11946_c0_g1_i1.p1  ORF type:complete len:456 (-),score=104.00 TRINITY_DN11946_c0_g1_i1:59-1426(-)
MSENGAERMEAVEDCDIIQEGATVVLQKFNYMRTHVLNPKKTLLLGRDTVSMSGVVGKKYGTTFEMVSDPKNKKQFQLVEANEVIDFESLFLTGEGGQDNRDLEDTENSQKLSREQVEEMRDSGVSGKVIMEKLIENSETYQSKTKFSQAKFLKKKAKKYHHYIIFRKPTVRLLIDILYKMDPMKIMNLRIDSLSQILNMVNVQSGGRYMVYETGAQGIVVASLLERLGDAGELVHVYQTGQPQTACLNSMGLHKSPLLKTLNISHLRSLEHGKNIIFNHPKSESKDAENGAEETSDQQCDKTSEKDTDAEPEKKRIKLENGTKEPESENSKESEENDQKKPVRMNLRERSVEAFNSIKAESLDGLVIVCKQHPGNIITYLAKYIKPSRPFVIYSPYKEPLMDTYMQLKEARMAVMVMLTETWLRSHQVLPRRTHPTVLMSGGGGYLLTGIFVQN